MGSWKRMAMSMGANSVDEVAAELGSLMKAKPPTSFREAIKLLGQALDLRHAKPKVVKDGPCKEVVHRFDESERRGSRAGRRRRTGAIPRPSTLDPRRF